MKFRLAGYPFFIFIIPLLSFLVFFNIKTNFTLAQQYPGGCGNARCDLSLGEDCNTCPQDCGSCPWPGYVQCGSGTCPNNPNKTFWTYCSPSCTAVPRTCYNDPPCDWPPPHCGLTDQGCPPGACPPDPDCGEGNVNCGVVVCNCDGGNCYSDCSNCGGGDGGDGGTPIPTSTSTPPPPPSPPSCVVSLSPLSMTLRPGQSSDLVASVVVENGSVIRVDFVSSDSSVVSLSQASDDTYPYSTAATGINSGSATVTATASVWGTGGYATCSTTATTDCDITVVPPSPWFQTQGGDVHGQGDIYSPVPYTATNKNFSVDLDNYPGLVSYGGGTASFAPAGSVSLKGWLANSGFISSYNYRYFYEKLGSPTEDNFSCDPSCPTPPSGQTTIYYSADSVSIDGNNEWNIPANTKVVVLVNGDLNISLNQGRRITVPVGSFLAFIVSGNINISGNVGDKLASTTPHLQGMYLADGAIDTYQPNPSGGGEGSGFRLVGAGLFYARNGFNLERNLKNDCGGGICNANTPAELFLFRPDLVLNAPRELWVSRMSWQEVAP